MPDATSINTGTPTVTVVDNRGIAIRTLQFCRTVAGGPADLRVIRATVAPAGHLLTQSDPRLGDAGLVNITRVTAMGGALLHQSGCDDGSTWQFADILGRPCWQQDGAGTVTTFTHDALGRRQTISRLDPSAQPGSNQAYVRERHYYGDTSPPALVPRDRAQTANLCGQPVCIWNSAGQQGVAAVSLTGVALTTSRRLLLKGDGEGDWSGDDTQASTWQSWEAALDKTHYLSTVTLNATGQLLTHTNAAGHRRRQAYDVAGMLASQWLTLNGQTEQRVVQSQTYNAAGRPLMLTQGNGVTVEHTYEAETQRLNATSIARVASGKTTVLQALAYTHDPVGNVLTVTDTSQVLTWFRNQQISPVSTFTYDSLYQLLTATGREMANQKRQGTALPDLITPLPADSSQYTAYTRSYVYDRASNLTQVRHSAPKTGNQWTSNIVLSTTSNRGVSDALFAAVTPAQIDTLFDSRGQQNQLQPGQLLTWDAHGRLQQVRYSASADTQREYYGYAGANRILKVTEQRSQSTLWQRQALYLDGLELRTTAQDGVTQEALEVVCLGSENCGVRALHWTAGKPAGIDNDSIRYRYGNPVGSIELELDQQGAIISREEYYPFGGTAVWATRSQTEASYKTQRFSGKERDTTGLYYYGYRYYQPWSGRWLSADPAGPVDGLNLYQMVRNNPVSNSDAQGLSITVGKEKYKTGALFKRSPTYKKLAETYTAQNLEKLISHYNATDEVFLSEAHLLDLVQNDIHSHLANDALDEHQLAQRDYMTRAGIHARLKTSHPTEFPLTQRPQAYWKAYPFAGPARPLENVDTALGGAASTAKVSVFRTMTHAEAAEVVGNGNYDAIGKHLGDFSQALSYFHRDGVGKALIEFPLKPGAHELLFTPAFSAVLDSGNVTSVMATLADLNLQGNYAKAKKGEGMLSGYIGIKPEEHGVSGFSLSIGDKDSRELFKRFVDRGNVRELLRR